MVEHPVLPPAPAPAPVPADADTAAREVTPEASTLIEEELLVEDVSIDGMCGVY